MSVKVMGLVWDHYPEGGGELLTALKLADHADHDGSNIWPSVHQVAEKTRQSRRTVQYHLRAMVERGWLLVVAEGGGRERPTRYRMPIELIPQDVLGTAQKLHRLGLAASPGVRGGLIGAIPAPIVPDETVQPGAQTVQPGAGNGATAIAPEPSRTVSTSTVSTPTRGALDYQIPETTRAWAGARGWAPFLELHREHFNDYLNGSDRVRKRYTDLDAAFRNCVRSDWGGVRRMAMKEGRTSAQGPLPEDTTCRRILPGTSERCGLPGKRHPVYGYSCEHCDRKEEEALATRTMPGGVRVQLDHVLRRRPKQPEEIT